jgi:hypothetical protein
MTEKKRGRPGIWRNMFTACVKDAIQREPELQSVSPFQKELVILLVHDCFDFVENEKRKKYQNQKKVAE